MWIKRDRFFVITGGPGAGKTSLINELRSIGIRCVDEVARTIIRAQVRTGGHALPWVDSRLFAEMIIRQDVSNFLAAEPEVPTVFDRGVIDALSYASMVGLSVPERLRDAAVRCRYNLCAFIAPPWAEIYATDAESRQGYAEAVRTHDVVARAYRDAGYLTVELPLTGLRNGQRSLSARRSLRGEHGETPGSQDASDSRQKRARDVPCASFEARDSDPLVRLNSVRDAGSAIRKSLMGRRIGSMTRTKVATSDRQLLVQV
jgi:predicted ATPase